MHTGAQDHVCVCVCVFVCVCVCVYTFVQITCTCEKGRVRAGSMYIASPSLYALAEIRFERVSLLNVCRPVHSSLRGIHRILSKLPGTPTRQRSEISCAVSHLYECCGSGCVLAPIRTCTHAPRGVRACACVVRAGKFLQLRMMRTRQNA